MYNNPVNVIETHDWKNKYEESLQVLDIRNPLFVTSSGNVERNNLSNIIDDSRIFTEIQNNPTFASCEKAINYIKNVKCDGIIALGGGSVMDTTKVMMAAIGTDIYDLKELLVFDKKFPNRAPAIFIPTTHGSASEVTMWGALWNMEEKQKYSLSHPSLYPDIAILDAKLTLSMDLQLSVTTVLDALSHSFETIWNKNSNTKSLDYAYKSIEIILEEVPNLKKDITDLKVREKLLRASNLAGLAFSNTKTAAAHSISYPLTFSYNIPHGIACSLPIIPLLRLNKEAIEIELNELLSFLNINYEELEEKILNIPKNVIDFNLSKWGIKSTDIDEIVDRSFTKSRIFNNVVKLTKEDVRHLLEQIM
ncbi:phosphonoacetaldehyde reductase [Candidatus Neomarinimicrobiota bacterium]